MSEALGNERARAEKILSGIIGRQAEMFPGVIDLQAADIPTRVGAILGNYGKTAGGAEPTTPEDALVAGLHHDIALVMNPAASPERSAAIDRLLEQLPPQAVEQIEERGRRGYVGPGWTEQEREFHKQRHGDYPGNWRLGPGDYLEYQRRLDHDYIRSIQGAVSAPPSLDTALLGEDNASHRWRPLSAKQEDPRLLALRTASDDYERAKAANENYELGGDRTYASGLTGSVYPWRRGLLASFGDAIGLHDSPIARYVQGSALSADMASYFGLHKGANPLNAGPYFEARGHLDRVSPVVKGDSPGDREAYLRRHKNALELAKPRTYSEDVLERTGKPASYLGQGAMSFLHALTDISPIGIAAAPKVVNKAAMSLARTALPVASTYGAHIANKTMSASTTPLARLLLQETAEDVPLSSALQGATTAMSPSTPPLSKWLSRDLKDRKDMEALTPTADFDQIEKKPYAEMSPSEIRRHFENQPKYQKQALDVLDTYNREHPDSILHGDQPGILTTVGRMIGDPEKLAKPLNDLGKVLGPEKLEKPLKNWPGNYLIFR